MTNPADLQAVKNLFISRKIQADVAQRWAEHHTPGYTPDPPLLDREIDESSKILFDSVPTEGEQPASNRDKYKLWGYCAAIAVSTSIVCAATFLGVRAVSKNNMLATTFFGTFVPSAFYFYSTEALDQWKKSKSL